MSKTYASSFAMNNSLDKPGLSSLSWATKGENYHHVEPSQQCLGDQKFENHIFHASPVHFSPWETWDPLSQTEFCLTWVVCWHPTSPATKCRPTPGLQSAHPNTQTWCSHWDYSHVLVLSQHAHYWLTIIIDEHLGYSLYKTHTNKSNSFSFCFNVATREIHVWLPYSLWWLILNINFMGSKTT